MNLGGEVLDVLQGGLLGGGPGPLVDDFGRVGLDGSIHVPLPFSLFFDLEHVVFGFDLHFLLLFVYTTVLAVRLISLRKVVKGKDLLSFLNRYFVVVFYGYC